MVFTGTVVKGNQIGRTIGFATANLELPPQTSPVERGVFGCVVRFEDGRTLPGMLNVGTRPTIRRTDLPDRRTDLPVRSEQTGQETRSPMGGPFSVTVEVHIIDFTGNLYGQRLQVETFAKIRDEQKFNNLDQLKTQLEKDRNRILEIYGTQKTRKQDS